MKRLVPLIILILFSHSCYSQTSFAWERPLIICMSSDGRNFSGCSLFQDSSGVPSLAIDSTGRLLSAFQWFPDPFQGPHWDSVAVKISLDSGNTWTVPEPIVVQNLPFNFQRPFDPTLVALPGGQIRIYFSSGPPGINTIATYSALGTDGVHYTFEPGIRFSQVNRNCIDPAVIFFQGMYHYTSPKGAPQDGAFHAVSTDGLSFSQVADIVSDASHNWTGNMMVDSLALKFYGCGGPVMWYASTANGNQWSFYQPLNISGGDPAVVKIPGRNYIIVYTGPPGTTSISKNEMRDIMELYPNPAKEVMQISGLTENKTALYAIIDLYGRIIQRGQISPMSNEVSIHSVAEGMYIFRMETSGGLYQKIFQVLH